jgi:hypothetical protein
MHDKVAHITHIQPWDAKMGRYDVVWYMACRFSYDNQVTYNSIHSLSVGHKDFIFHAFGVPLYGTYGVEDILNS